MIRWPDALNPTRFLETHWQKRWLALPSALPHVPESLTPEVLAGLACEVEVESRLVVRREDSFEVRYGPFDESEIAGLPARNWTLLVQNVESHLPELRTVLESFSFLPSWRLDDLMVSYATPGGTVGAHIDEYDVFLLQGSGQRVWQLDPDPPDLAHRPGLDIRVLRSFRAMETVTTNPGDLLYLPPGVAHYGVGDTPSMTWSIGFRAPSSADLLYAAADRLEACTSARYADRDLAGHEIRGSRLDQAAADRVRRLLSTAIPPDDAGLLDLLGRAATRLKPWLRPDPPTESTDATTVLRRLESGHTLRRHPASRLAWTETTDQVVLFVDGLAYRLPRTQVAIAAYLAEEPSLVAEAIAAHTATAAVAELLASLITQGSLFWEDSATPGATPGRASR